jgi:hypothetical protein
VDRDDAVGREGEALGRIELLEAHALVAAAELALDVGERRLALMGAALGRDLRDDEIAGTHRRTRADSMSASRG